MAKVLPPMLMPTNPRTDLGFERGEGAYLYGSDGKRYLDFFSGIAVSTLGHAHPHLVETLRSHADKLWHITNNYRIPEQERLAERLTALSFADRAFFCNSGLEAAEGAIKLARKAQHTEGKPNRTGIVTIEGAFHGRSIAALAATGNGKYLEGFGPRAPGFSQVPFGDVAALEAALDGDVAAVMIEPVQGEGGVRPLDLDYLRRVRRLCDANDVFLVFDEVQCGMGRTGRLFAYQWAEVAPDIMMLAKGLGGGFPVGAILATERVGQCLTPGTHGSTFGGNPLAMAIANAVLDILVQQGFLEGVDRIARLLWSELESLVQRHGDVFSEVRGAGLLLGLRCIPPAGACVDAVRADGMLTHTAGENVLRMLPPLIIGERQVAEAIRHLESAASAIGRTAGAA